MRPQISKQQRATPSETREAEHRADGTVSSSARQFYPLRPPPLFLGAPDPSLKRAAGSGMGLPDPLKAGLESLSGLAMDDVRVHYNSARPARVSAHAYTRGADIHLAAGQEEHLPHEAWHAVQQMQGRVRPTHALPNGVPGSQDEGLEREADVMGRRAELVGHGRPTLRRSTSDGGPGVLPRVTVAGNPIGSAAAPVQRMKFGRAKRFTPMFTTHTGLQGHILGQSGAQAPRPAPRRRITNRGGGDYPDDLLRGGPGTTRVNLAVFHELWQASQRDHNIHAPAVAEYQDHIRSGNNIEAPTIQHVDMNEDGQLYIRTLEGRHRISAAHAEGATHIYVSGLTDAHRLLIEHVMGRGDLFE